MGSGARPTEEGQKDKILGDWGGSNEGSVSVRVQGRACVCVCLCVSVCAGMVMVAVLLLGDGASSGVGPGYNGVGVGGVVCCLWGLTGGFRYGWWNKLW